MESQVSKGGRWKQWSLRKRLCTFEEYNERAESSVVSASWQRDARGSSLLERPSSQRNTIHQRVVPNEASDVLLTITLACVMN